MSDYASLNPSPYSSRQLQASNLHEMTSMTTINQREQKSMSFNLEEAIKTANQAVLANRNRNLTDVEIIILKGAWAREEYDQIAAKHQYATSYISQDVAPKLWRLLTDALGEKVKKSNFKEALKRYRERELSDESSGREKFSDNISLTESEAFLPSETLIRLKISRFIGKPALVHQILMQVANSNERIIHLSFDLAHTRHQFTQLDQLLRWLCSSMSQALNLSDKLESYWDKENIGEKVSCTTYLEQYLLAQSNYPLILCLDNLDLLSSHLEVYEDFLELLRCWYEKTRSHRIWAKVRFVLVYQAEIQMPTNMSQSPFNIGIPLKWSQGGSREVVG